VSLGLAANAVPAGTGPLRVVTAAAVQCGVSGSMALLACAVLGQLGDLADQELMARAGLALVCALGLQYAAMGAGRTGWFAVWKNAEAKDLDLVLDWRDHGPQGLWGRRSTQQNLAFHARKLAFLARAWAPPVRVQPGFSFALYLRACLDAVQADLLVMSATSTFLAALLICATVPLWPFAVTMDESTRGELLVLAILVLVFLVVMITLHLQQVVHLLTPPTDSLRLGSVAAPPYLDRPTILGVTKHAQLFFVSPQLLLDTLRAILLVLALCAASCVDRRGWTVYVSLGLCACGAALVPAAAGLLAVSTSIEMLVRTDLVPLSNRAAPKKFGYRRILRLVKVKAAQAAPPCVRVLGEMCASWPPRRREEVEQVLQQRSSAQLTRVEVQGAAHCLGATEARVVDAWFDFLAEDGLLSARAFPLLVAGLDKSEEPLQADAEALFPAQLDAPVLAKAFWDLGLDVHVDACAEILRCLPQQTSAQVVRWLQSFE